MNDFEGATMAIRESWLAVARFFNQASLEKLSEAVDSGKLSPEAFSWLQDNVDPEFPGPDITLLETVKELFGTAGVEEVMANAEAAQAEEHAQEKKALRKAYGFRAMLKAGFKSFRL